MSSQSSSVGGYPFRCRVLAQHIVSSGIAQPEFSTASPPRSDPRPKVAKASETSTIVLVPGYSVAEPWSFAWHAGQLEVQTRAGRRHSAESIKNNVNPEIAYRFAPIVNQQHVAFVASLGDDGFPWASVILSGEELVDGDAAADATSSGQTAGVLRAVPNSNKVSIRIPAEGRPSTGWCCPSFRRNISAAGAPVALIAMDFERRMRYRANGHVVGSSALDTATQQESPILSCDVATRNNWVNCTSFIPKVRLVNGALSATGQLLAKGNYGDMNVPVRTSTSSVLSPSQCDLVRDAFVLFISSAQSATGPRIDINMRAGRPGFVRVSGGGSIISFPDYPGNGSFITLGNLTSYPRCGLLFPFLPNGCTLQMLGDVAITWSKGNCDEGMDRQVTMSVRSVVETVGLAPLLSWHLMEHSVFSPPPGVDAGWFDRQGACTVLKLHASNGVARVAFAGMGKTNWAYKPGQYAKVMVRNPRQFQDAAGGEEALMRSFTISFADMGPPELRSGSLCARIWSFVCNIRATGAVTQWLYDLPVDAANQVLGGESGTEVTVAAVEGDFCIDVLEVEAPVPPKILMVSAGIGITPMLAMISGLQQARERFGKRYPVDVVLLHSSRSLADVVDREKLEKIAKRSSSTEEAWQSASVKVQWLLTGMEASPTTVDFDQTSGVSLHHGRLTPELLSHVPDVALRETFVCGPPMFMDAAIAMLHTNVGLPLSRIRTESFEHGS